MPDHKQMDKEKRRVMTINAQELAQAFAQEQRLEVQAPQLQEEEEEWQLQGIDNNVEILQAQATVQAGVQAADDDIPLQEAPAPELMREHRGKKARRLACEEKNLRTKRRWEKQHPVGDLGAVDLKKMTGMEELIHHSYYLANRELSFADRLSEKNLTACWETPDPIGYEWRAHCKKYQKTSLKSPSKKMQQMVARDVENLYDSYKLAIYVEKKLEIAPEMEAFARRGDIMGLGNMKQLMDGLGSDFFKQLKEYKLFLEEQSREKGMDAETAAALQMIQKIDTDDSVRTAMAGEAEAFKSRLATTHEMIKNNMGTFVPRVVMADGNLKALNLAMKSVQQMPAGNYRSLMEREISRRIDEVQTYRDEIWNDTLHRPVSTVQFTPEERQKKQVAVDLCSGVLKKMDKLYERSQIQDRSAPGVEMPFFNTLMDGITEGFQFRDFILKYMAWKKTDMDNGLAEERIARAAWLRKRAQEQSQS